MKNSIKTLAVSVLLLTLNACGAVDGHKYLFTGKEAAPPPRTIQAAKSNFNDSKLIINKSTESELKTELGSPSEVSSITGRKVYTYTKSIPTKGISVDVGTIYIAKYTFEKNGKLSKKSYSSKPMNNPLLN